MSEHIVDINAENAQQLLIDESFQRPVLVDVWADWCQPCKTLMPMLEKLAVEYAGQFLLARINADEQQALAGQLGARSLPTVLLIKDGQPVDGFTGVQPESAVRELLDKYLPKPWDLQLTQAQEHIAQGELKAALPLLHQAYPDSRQRADIALELSHVLLELNRVQEASTILEAVALVDQEARYQQLLAQLELKQQSAHTPEIQTLQAQLNEQPDNLNLAYQLAIQFSQHEHHGEALALLWSVLQQDKDFQEGAAKKALLDIVVSLGSGDPLATEYQRKLFGLLY
jgi:putative thioredoxin